MRMLRGLRSAVMSMVRPPERAQGTTEGLDSLSEELQAVLRPVTAPEAFRDELRDRLLTLAEEPSSPWRRSRIVLLGAAVVALSLVIAAGGLVARLLRRDGRTQPAS